MSAQDLVDAKLSNKQIMSAFIKIMDRLTALEQTVGRLESKEEI